MTHLAIGLAAASLFTPPGAWPGEVQRRPGVSPAVRLLQDDRLDEAARADLFDVDRSYTLVLAAEKAVANSRVADALCLYEAYLRHYPLGRYASFEWTDGTQGHGFSNQDEYYRAVTGYLNALAETEKPTAEWYRQTRASLPVYDRLRAAYAKKDAAAYVQLADDIVTDHPLSLLVQPAVLTAAYGRCVVHHSDDFPPGPSFLRRYLKLMDRSGVPPRDRCLVLLMYMERAGREHERVDVSAELAWVRGTTRSLPVRRSYMSGDLFTALKAKETAAVGAAADRLLATYPDEVRWVGRDRVVSVCHDAKEPDVMLAFARRWAADKAAYHGSAAELAAGLYEEAKQWDKAGEVYRGLVAAAGPRGSAGLKLRLAYMLRTSGDAKQALAVVREVAETEPPPPPPPGRFGGPGAAHDSDRFDRARARRMLADHHFDAKEYAEALKWYEAWTPDAGRCGTGFDAVLKHKADRTAECRKRLGRP